MKNHASRRAGNSLYLFYESRPTPHALSQSTIRTIVSDQEVFAMRILILLFALLLSASTAFAQGAIPPDGQLQAEQAERQFEKTVPPPIHQQPSVDLAKVRRDADELVMLSQSIHSGIDNVGKGMLPKDLIDKLKQMEKLSKRLRGELTP
jgi:hypothetical protein